MKFKWKKVVERSENAQRNLRQVLNAISEKELEQNSLEEKLQDIMLHDAYHTGQIIQLRKIQGVMAIKSLTERSSYSIKGCFNGGMITKIIKLFYKRMIQLNIEKACLDQNLQEEVQRELEKLKENK
ncbi:hypothetical protein DJ93_3458 [Bacillus clarus]|uniref:Uncharacterized protein n=1 Tax=Bacillus clarus TaxID=2338372 RepID=A0A090Z0Q4_9BACI|nr:hypothetical protein DJ93_3458 [Bacillus clarus]